MVSTAARIFRAYQTDGVPASGVNEPDKREVLQWGTMLEALVQGKGLGYATLALVNADLAHDANVLAIVFSDGTAANNGTYAKVGASGVGSWTRVGDLPGAVLNLTVSGGSANAIQATAIETPLQPGAKLYLLTPTAANTTTTTLALNGGSAVEIKNAFGMSLAANSLLAGNQVLMAWQTDHFQLLLSANPDASAFTAACAASASAAAASASAAAASAASLSGIVGMSPPGGRTSLTSGVAITTTDVAAASVIYYMPSLSEWLRVYDGTNDVLTLFPQLSLTLDPTSGHTNYHQSGKQFDGFVAINSGSPVLGTGPAWASDTARGTGAGTTELEFFKGLWRNKNTITLRIGPNSGDTISVPARRATAVKSIRASADGQTSDTQLKRFVFNFYNPVPRTLFVNAEALGSTWPGPGTAFVFRQVNANANNKVAILQGLPGGPLWTRAIATAANASGNVAAFAGIGINSTTVNSGKGGTVGPAAAGTVCQGESEFDGYTSLGYSEINWLEAAAAASGFTMYSGDASASLFQSGLQARVWA